jgi:hypothetical protein
MAEETYELPVGISAHIAPGFHILTDESFLFLMTKRQYSVQ